ncbi:MAG TPA: sensor histidine kinase [Anaerolineae bacterium]|nr:sensor histidine kinase [Anaerolineae bacterium]
MMRTVGVYLIYAAVVLRGWERLPRMRYPDLVVALLVVHGLLLVVETWMIERKPLRFTALAGPGSALKLEGLPVRPRWFPLVYLFVQSGLVIGLLLNRPVQDFYALLFMPLSLQAVLFLGRRGGFLCISAFTLAMAGPLAAAQEGWIFGVVMVLNYGGLCFLFGGYAHQIGQAEAARNHNQHMLGELQAAYRQLQGYAVQVEDLASEQERNRLSRELHDSVTQTVFSMNLTVQSARLLLERDPDRVSGQLLRLEELAASAMDEIQTLVLQLLPTSMAEEGLPAALRRLASERLVRDRLDVTLEVSGKRDLLDSEATGLYCIAQEALTNVAKHAGTGQAALRLNLVPGASFLEIEDGGLGFNPKSASSQLGHLGLAGMAERARELGWSLFIESEPGRGTCVRVEENMPGGTG